VNESFTQTLSRGEGLGEVSNFGSSPLGRLGGAQILNYKNAERPIANS